MPASTISPANWPRSVRPDDGIVVVRLVPPAGILPRWRLVASEGEGRDGDNRAIYDLEPIPAHSYLDIKLRLDEAMFAPQLADDAAGRAAKKPAVRWWSAALSLTLLRKQTRRFPPATAPDNGLAGDL